jgi:hypothetical protein
MSKKVLVSTLLAVLFVGCGSGGGDTSSSRDTPTPTPTNQKQYNLWSYMTPQDSHTNTYSIYSDNKTIKYNTQYSVKQNRVIEINDYASNEKTIYEKLSNKIKVRFEKNNKANGMYELHLTANEGDVITERSSTCKLTKHYDTFEIKGKSFTDVIEIKCGDIPGYYQKGVGEIAQVEEKNRKSIRVLSN